MTATAAVRGRRSGSRSGIATAEPAAGSARHGRDAPEQLGSAAERLA